MPKLYEVQSNGVTVDTTPNIQEAQRLFYQTHGEAKIYEISCGGKLLLLYRQAPKTRSSHPCIPHDLGVSLNIKFHR